MVFYIKWADSQKLSLKDEYIQILQAPDSEAKENNDSQLKHNLVILA